jgi:hypothetical protein
VEFKIVGLRVIKFVDAVTQGHNCDFRKEPENGERYEVLLNSVQKVGWGANERHQPYVLHLRTDTGSCGSGWTTASWSDVSLESVKSLGPMTHRPTQEMLVEFDGAELPETFDCAYFGWSGDGGCGYYPSGGASVAMGFFESTGRGLDKPLVHVFLGDSNTGKSTLAQMLGDARLEDGQIGWSYETDRSEEFQETMAFARVIVLGNKYPEQTLTGIREFFINKKLDVEIVPVRFGEPIRFGEEG